MPESRRGRAKKGAAAEASPTEDPEPAEAAETEDDAEIQVQKESDQEIPDPLSDPNLSPEDRLHLEKVTALIRREVLKTVKESIKTAVPTAVKAALSHFNDKIDKVERRLDKIDTIEKTLEDALALQAEVNTLKKENKALKSVVIPRLVEHMNDTVVATALQNISLNMHARKWNVLIQGVDGEKDEESDATRKAVIKMAKENLKLKDTKDTPLNEGQLAACHRLQSSAGSAIIARFVDLKQRDRWLAKAKNLKGSNISMSVDVPPCLRNAKKELMKFRKDLSPDEKKKSFIKYLPSWPYLTLHRKEQEPMHHTFSKTQIIEHALGIPEGKSVIFTMPSG